MKKANSKKHYVTPSDVQKWAVAYRKHSMEGFEKIPADTTLIFHSDQGW